MVSNTMQDEDEVTNHSELSAIIGALFGTLNDKEGKVIQNASKSLKEIAAKQPNVVIYAAIYFWEMHRKMTDSHLLLILQIMTDTCQNHIKHMDNVQATSVADLALVEFSGNHYELAADLLVALSKTQCSQAIGALIIKFEPNLIPHHMIIKALGMIAMKHPLDLLPFFKVILNSLIPLLPLVTEEQIKLACTFSLAKIADAINDCLTNSEIMSQTGLSKDMYFDELSSAFELIAFHWLRASRNTNVAESILLAISSILPLLPQIFDEKLIVKLTPILYNHCKKSSGRLAALKALSALLSGTTNDIKEFLKPYLEILHNILLDMICISPFEAARDAVLIHYESLQCFRSIVLLHPEEGLERVLLQLKSQSVSQRSKALVVLRHLINTMPTEDDVYLQKIALYLQDSLSEGSTRQLVGAIVALAARPAFSLSPSQRSSFVKFMVLQCGSKSDESESCEEALHLLSSTVAGAEIWLWPALIKALLDYTFAASAISILRALSSLPGKIFSDENTKLVIEKDFEKFKVLSRCLELMDNTYNRPGAITFLRISAPLFVDTSKDHWEVKLGDMLKFLDQVTNNSMSEDEFISMWEAKLVDFLEESVTLEGEIWGNQLAEELADKSMLPNTAICFSAVASSAKHITMLIDMARLHSVASPGQKQIAKEYARAVGICSRRHLDLTLKLTEEFYNIEESRKQPVKLLGFVRDSKQAASNEAAKAGLLHSYAEIARKANAKELFSAVENHIAPWATKQLQDCKEISTKEAGLLVLEQCGMAVHRVNLLDPKELSSRSAALIVILGLFETPYDEKLLKLFPLVLKAIISLIKVPPILTPEEKKVLLETVMDKVIAKSPELGQMKLPHAMQQVIESLGIISSEIVGDSADTLALLVDILLPWMQSKSYDERRTTLLVLRSTLRSYHDSLKYTYPGGKLEPGKLLGRFISWSADSDLALRPLVVDCVALALNIGARHRSSISDNSLSEDLNETKRIIVNSDSLTLYEGVQNLAIACSERIASGEIVSFAEGLVEGLLYRGKGGTAASIALSELFRLRGMDIPRANLYLVDSIISQMRQMENEDCRKKTAATIKCLSKHHLQDVVDHLLRQPLPLDGGTKECWKELSKEEEINLSVMEQLLTRLNSDNLSAETTSAEEKRDTASFSSLSAIVAIGQLLQSGVEESEILVKKLLPELLSVLLEHLAGWLHCDPPMSTVNSKFGFVPNRDFVKIIPHRETYTVIITVMQLAHATKEKLDERAFDSESSAENSLITTVYYIVKNLSNQTDTLSSLVRKVGRLVTRPLPAQRALAIALYTETMSILGNSDTIWLDAIVNTLQDAKTDSCSLVRKLALSGLTEITNLKPKLIEEYYESCLSSLLEGLEEPTTNECNTEVVMEALRGLASLLAVKIERPISPQIILALRPFVEKENSEMRLLAIVALGAAAEGWQRIVSTPDDDVTDHLLGCLPCLIIKLNDNVDIAMASRYTLCTAAPLMQCDPLAEIITTHLNLGNELEIEGFLQHLVGCLKTSLPARAEELRNAIVRSYSCSENFQVREISALMLGFFGKPTPEVVQRQLHLLHDQESSVRARAARGLGLSFTH